MLMSAFMAWAFINGTWTLASRKRISALEEISKDLRAENFDLRRQMEEMKTELTNNPFIELGKRKRA